MHERKEEKDHSTHTTAATHEKEMIIAKFTKQCAPWSTLAVNCKNVQGDSAIGIIYCDTGI